MRVGDLIRIKPEHWQEEDDPTSWQTYPPDSQWIGLVTGILDKHMIEVMWAWSGIAVSEYTEHLEVICK
jgi:hypothetical protein